MRDEVPIRAVAWIALGSNLGDREGYLRSALEALAGDPAIEVSSVSSFRETDPVGHVEQPRFLNAAARLETTLPARELLDRLLEIERAHGRERAGPRFGPRTLDLDLLLFEDDVIAEPGLSIPHPRLHERRFVLEPLVELDPGLIVPGLGPVEALLRHLH